ncbi:glycosyltransferase [Methylomicrobium sp. RS1]|uniref:glycosyltransferase n=1 Tax=Candidatus Methylomicrobium oryzae TaxID=2802053 RepID=UPI001923C58C|nr:glycosyltransferase [Methylomicrobium sp. RS1]MBL1264984.1 glycosyltransferase [Methylomicrobium sp. RS1]
MSSETVAVITTVLNERDGLEELLESILSQTRKPDEIVIVDGGSTDGTIDVLNKYCEKNPFIKFYIEPGVNIAEGRNIAISRANSSIIAVTDGGCKPVNYWLEALTQPLLDNTAYGAVSGVRLVDSKNNFELFAGQLSTSGNAANEQDRVFHGRNSAFRKSVWEEVGGYPEWLYTAEDTLFAKKAKSLGCRVAVAPNAIISWRPRPNIRKLAKQYYLYGKGTGRIAQTDLKTVLYHLRNHSIWIITLLLGIFFPWIWLLTLAVLVFMYITLVKPVLKKIKSEKTTPSANIYVPLIVMVRSFFNNLGQLYGYWEYKRVPPFKMNLDLYFNGDWKALYKQAK